MTPAEFRRLLEKEVEDISWRSLGENSTEGKILRLDMNEGHENSVVVFLFNCLTQLLVTDDGSEVKIFRATFRVTKYDTDLGEVETSPAVMEAKSHTFSRFLDRTDEDDIEIDVLAAFKQHLSILERWLKD